MGKIISNEKIDKNKVDTASRIIKDLYIDIPKCVAEGFGPFVAAIYDSEGSLIAKEANSVILDCNSNNHAEMRVIQKAEEVFGTYDLSSFNLKLYVTSEPCIMCAGGIIWSGIKELYYGVPSEKVEQITGFDEGFKPNWIKEFKKRGITVYGNIETELGECELQKYISNGNKIYKPLRK